MKNRLLFFLAITVFLLSRATAQQYTLNITDVQLREIYVKGFVLNQDRTVHIKAVGAGMKMKIKRRRSPVIDRSHMFAYAWILNSHTREVVWKLDFDTSKPTRGSRYLREFDGEVHLPAGEYEVYYYSASPLWIHHVFDGFFSLGRLLDYILSGDEDFDEFQDEWGILVEGIDGIYTRQQVLEKIQQQQQEAVASIHEVGNSQYIHTGFQVFREGTFEVYCIGESFNNELFDYGWIVRQEDNRKVWEAVPEDARYAGGAMKNKMWRKNITLPPGKYWVYYLSDDSHSFEKWNANPPADPFYYGITVFARGKHLPVKPIQPVESQQIQPIVALTRLGNNADVERRIVVKETTQVHIIAFGEGRAGEMFDYGWISDNRTGKTVWKMTFENTQYGGGASKNRMVDEYLTLPPGDYSVHFVTDDSHAYGSWNARPPFNPTRWGITLLPASPHQKPRIQVLESPRKNGLPGETILAKLTHVKNNERVTKLITLPETTRIKIIAVGEGDWDEMYDYGWIENAETGEVVWKMSYENTRWAGGARKNRMAEAELTLPPGKYKVVFQTDDSHCYGHWNARPPRRPDMYGITVIKIK